MNPLPNEAAILPSTLTSPGSKQQLENTLNQLTTPGIQLKSIDTEQREITTGELVEPIQRINEAMRPRGIEFELSEETSRVITRVIDRESGEVIRQIPGEEVLKIAERLEEIQGQIISLEA